MESLLIWESICTKSPVIAERGVLSDAQVILFHFFSFTLLNVRLYLLHTLNLLN